MLQVLRKIQTLSLSLGVGGSYSVLTKPFYPRSLGNIFHRSTCPAQGVNKKSHSLHSWAGSKYWRALSITFPGNSSQHRLASPILRSSINKTSSLLPGAKSISVPAMFDNPESSDPRSNRLIWVDLEMTGLDFVEDRILEIACLITEGDLRIVAEGPHIIIHESDEVLNRMGEWCTQHHGESGLTEAVRKSKISLAEAEQMVLDFVRQHTPKGKCPLAGNTISMDRSFILKHMPLLAEHLHYRVLDVSTVKELCRRWYEKDLKVAPVKKNNHRAVDDILESIEELKFYRSAIFK